MNIWYVRVPFAVALLGWAMFIFFYFNKNDFAKESFAIFQSTLAAVAVSVVLAVKAIWLQAPMDKVLSKTIVILHETTTGRLFSPLRAHVDDLPAEYITSSRGLEEIETLPIHEKLKSLKLSEALVSA